MALHFERSEFASRMQLLLAEINKNNLDGMLLFSQESMYWLTGYDTFGFCFFQCLVVKKDGTMALLTRAPDLRQAQQTSIIDNIIIWKDAGNAQPANDLKTLLNDMGLKGATLGVEYDTHGLTGKAARAIDAALKDFASLQDETPIIPTLRSVKSQAELDYARKAGELADDALDAAVAITKAGAYEGDILAAMMSALFVKGGDYPANEFIIGSGKDALLCRYKSGRRHLDTNDQLTLEWAGSMARYHAGMMATLIVGEPTSLHQQYYEAARDALLAVRDAMIVGNPISDMFDAHAKVMDDAGLANHRLNACGYSMGAAFTPCWMDTPMIYAGNETIISANMVLFTHMIIADSDTNTAMSLGRSYITTDNGPENLSRQQIDLITC
ncbi:MAG: Xaa-Pro peptidase family protein [Rhizobiaceae bacterium]|nr:Xaa-Pro peptidase family protein [Rhizobiaceae bacterium]